MINRSCFLIALLATNLINACTTLQLNFSECDSNRLKESDRISTIFEREFAALECPIVAVEYYSRTFFFVSFRGGYAYLIVYKDEDRALVIIKADPSMQFPNIMGDMKSILGAKSCEVTTKQE